MSSWKGFNCYEVAVVGTSIPKPFMACANWHMCGCHALQAAVDVNSNTKIRKLNWSLFLCMQSTYYCLLCRTTTSNPWGCHDLWRWPKLVGAPLRNHCRNGFTVAIFAIWFMMAWANSPFRSCTLDRHVQWLRLLVLAQSAPYVMHRSKMT